MSEFLALLFSLGLTAALAAWASKVFFGDYREGFRMLYHWTKDKNDDVNLPAEAEPRPPQSAATQGFFAGTFALIVVLGYFALLPVFRGLGG